MLITLGIGLSSRNYYAFASIIVFFCEIIFLRQAIHSRVVSDFYGLGGKDYLREAESEDLLLLLLLLSSNDERHVAHLTTN